MTGISALSKMKRNKWETLPITEPDSQPDNKGFVGAIDAVLI
jgi:hypothetical protein